MERQVAHPDRDHCPKPEVAVGRYHRLQRLVGEARQFVEEVDRAGCAGADEF